MRVIVFHILFIITTLFLHGTAMAGGDSGENILVNSNFNRGHAGWILAKYANASASLRIETSSVYTANEQGAIRIMDGADQLSDIQLFQNLSLKKDEVYMLYFKARVEEAKDIVVEISSDDTTYFTQSFHITPQKSFYGPLIFVPDRNDFFSKLTFHIGGNNTDILFDDIIVNEGLAVEEDYLLTQSDIRISPGNEANQYIIQFAKNTPKNWQISLLDEQGEKILTNHLPYGVNNYKIELPSSVKSGDLLLQISSSEHIITQPLKVGTHL